MTKTFLLRTLLAVTAFLAAGQAAFAQSAECQRYRAELASLERNSGGAPTGQMQAQRAEINRLAGYYRSIGCERGPLGFLAGPAPAECGSIAQQIRQLEAGYARLASQAIDPGDIDARRRQLQAAVQQSCSGDQPRGFFESIFGPPRGQPQPQDIAPRGQPIIADEGQGQGAMGGGRLICVKTCDGSFFPLNAPPGGQQSADEMCQALCPGAETTAYAYPGGDEGLNRAASLSGNKPYTSLANAFKFRKSFDESCACKKADESWAVVLRKAESMLDQRKGDMIVTAEKADELSRPKAVQARKAADKKADEEEKAAAESAAAAPTASKESSGIGPQSIENTTVVGQNEGATQEVASSNGQKKKVRVIAPNLIPVPNAQD